MIVGAGIIGIPFAMKSSSLIMGIFLIDEFNAHLDSLEKDSMYKTLLDNQTALDISN